MAHLQEAASITNTTHNRNITYIILMVPFQTFIAIMLCGSVLRSETNCRVTLLSWYKGGLLTMLQPTVSTAGLFWKVSKLFNEMFAERRARAGGPHSLEAFCFGRLAQIHLIPHKLLLCHENCPARRLNRYWWTVMYILGSVLRHRYPAEALQRALRLSPFSETDFVPLIDIANTLSSGV